MNLLQLLEHQRRVWLLEDEGGWRRVVLLRWRGLGGRRRGFRRHVGGTVRVVLEAVWVLILNIMYVCFYNQ